MYIIYLYIHIFIHVYIIYMYILYVNISYILLMIFLFIVIAIHVYVCICISCVDRLHLSLAEARRGSRVRLGTSWLGVGSWEGVGGQAWVFLGTLWQNRFAWRCSMNIGKTVSKIDERTWFARLDIWEFAKWDMSENSYGNCHHFSQANAHFVLRWSAINQP